MDEYIKRETAVSCAIDAIALGNTAYSDRFEIATRLRSIPAAHVRPVVRGKWEGNKRHQSCSECHMTYCVPDGQDGELDMTAYHFCPNCGAEMEE